MEELKIPLEELYKALETLHSAFDIVTEVQQLKNDTYSQCYCIWKT